MSASVKPQPPNAMKLSTPKPTHQPHGYALLMLAIAPMPKAKRASVKIPPMIAIATRVDCQLTIDRRASATQWSSAIPMRSFRRRTIQASKPKTPSKVKKILGTKRIDLWVRSGRGSLGSPVS